jgi:L-alanine-DL-glutamate epimerase-like enolase superfamily enzyme
MAHLRGLLSIPHNWHGGGTTMANAHFVAGVPNGPYCELNQTRNPLKEGIFKDPLTVTDGIMELPERPGFGMELVDEVERKFPYVPGGYLRPNPRLKSAID